MLQSKIGRNFLISFAVLNILLVGFFAYAVMKQPGLLPNFLPGKFGATASPDLSGNMLFYALLLLVDSALFLIFGVGGTWHALWAGLRISPRKMRWFLHERAGLANDISGVVATAVQEEEKDELEYLHHARQILLVGLVLFIVALPFVCLAYTHAAPAGAAIFENAGKPIANSAVTNDVVERFTVDQLAGALLLDIPEIFHLRATPVETNGANLLLGLLVLLYRTLVGFGVVLLIVGLRRANALRSYAMEVAMPVADIVAMEPMLQDGHGHHGHGHEEHGHDDHGHDDHAHDDKGHDDHGGHDDHASGGGDGHGDNHDDHGHGDNHGHSDQGDGHGDNHGHSDHSHGDHDHHAKDAA